MIEVKLPTPPTSPNVLQSALDAHIKWAIKSGSIVQMGERIARLSYYPHGLIQHTGSVNKADAALAPPRNNIRAKMKKRWGGSNAAAAASLESATEPTVTNNDLSISSESNGISMDIRSPASGILRIVYSETIVTNAIQIENQQSTVANIVLAAIEPCEHPALVGTLCAVCGMDTRASNVVVDLTNNEKEHEQESQQVRTILRREYGDSRHESSNGIEISTGDTTSSTDGVTNLTNNNQDNSSTRPIDTKTTKPSSSMIPNTSKSSNVRSLSSLLSGAKSTQEMQQHQKVQKRPPRNPDKLTANHNTQSTTTDSTMTQMTVSGGVTMTISDAEAKSISEADAKKLRESKQLCLVLDLDHTLLHATDDYRAGRFIADEIFASETEDKTEPNPQKRTDVRSILLPVEMPPEQYQQYIQRQQYQMQQSNQARPALPPIPNQKLRHFVKLRPHLKKFFESIQSTYKLSVYTAGTRAYAERIAVMICRHLAGALLDEEDLFNLRARVREKDDEVKRYKNWTERQKQLKLAKERDATTDSFKGKKNGGTSKVKKKGVSFSVGGGTHDNTDLDSNKETGEADREDEQLAVRVSDSLNVSQDEKNDNAIDVSSKRSADSRNATYIPRKKRKVESDSLIALIAPPLKKEASASDNIQLDEAEELKDPSVERDKLRKQLQEAEALEVEATGLRRKLFGSRIVSRTDVGDLGADVKSLKRVFPCGGVMVRMKLTFLYYFSEIHHQIFISHSFKAAIVDDRDDVWANAKNNESGRPGEPPDNLLLVRPYHWKPFSGYRWVLCFLFILFVLQSTDCLCSLLLSHGWPQRY